MKTMSKKLFLLFAIVLTAGIASAQRFAYVDSDYILNNVPEYTDAQKKLDDISKGWQKEVEDKYKEIDGLYKDYQANQVLLTEDMRKTKQKEIEDKEKAVKDLQKKHFGSDGDLFQKRQELIKPIQDKVYDAVSKISTQLGYDMIFDKNGGTTVMYSNSKLDVSDKVLAQMGYTPKTNTNTNQTPQNK